MYRKRHTKRKYRKLSAIITILLLLSASCSDYFPDTLPSEYVWRPLLAFPIGEANFGLKIPYGFDTSLLEIEPVSRRPYWDYLDSIPMSGGLGFDFEKVLGKREEIDSAVIRINTYNGFPIEIEIQGYLINENDEILDSLFEPKMVMARGELEGGGVTVRAALSQREIPFDSVRLDVLLQASKITFEGTVKSVPYFPEYTFRAQLAVVLGIVSPL